MHSLSTVFSNPHQKVCAEYNQRDLDLLRVFHYQYKLGQCLIPWQAQPMNSSLSIVFLVLMMDLHIYSSMEIADNVYSEPAS